MRIDWQQSVTQILRFIFYAALGGFVLTWSWQTGWNILGDPYQLGPYVAWLQLVFPLAGLGLWGAFFAQWALGELRMLHATRWFYLLLFTALLMLNVLGSVWAEGSLGWLSLWLTGCLALSLNQKNLFASAWFWGWYAVTIVLSAGLWYFAPDFINTDLLVLAGWLGALHWWQQTTQAYPRMALTLLTVGLVYFLPVSVGVQCLVVLSWLLLWGQEYRQYRRQKVVFWYVLMASLLLFGGWQVLPNFQGYGVWGLESEALGSFFNLWHGVGWGQLEWAQYLAQNSFADPLQIPQIWAGSRWWYEMGLLLLIWLPSLWLLTLGYEQKNVKFRSTVFWGIALLAPQLWLSPGGILLGCWWFFSRQSWEAQRRGKREWLIVNGG